MTRIWLKNIIFLAGLALFASGCSFGGGNDSAAQQDAAMEPEPPPIIEFEPPIVEEPEEAPQLSPVVAPDGWKFEKKAVIMMVKPSGSLNWYKESPHTVLMGVYQLADPNIFIQKAASKEGLQEMLTKVSFEPSTGILSSERRVISPGKNEVFVLDRAESAQYIGIAAGFFELNPEKSARLIQIPAFQDKPKKQSFWTRMNPLGDDPEPPPPRPGRMKIWVEMEKDQVENIQTHVE